MIIRVMAGKKKTHKNPKKWLSLLNSQVVFFFFFNSLNLLMLCQLLENGKEKKRKPVMREL